MPRSSGSELLVQASKARQQLGEVIGAYLGHLREQRRSSFEPWRGPVPGRLKWEETYQLQRVMLARPKAGATIVQVRCKACGDRLTLAVRSKRLILRYCLAVSIVVAVTARVAFACCPTPEALFWGAFWGLLFAIAPEVLGESDHHSAVKIIGGPPGQHQLFNSQEIRENPDSL